MDENLSWLQRHVPDEILTSKIFKFVITLTNGNKLEVNIANDIDIDIERVEEQIDEWPSQYIMWTTLYSEVRAVIAKLERTIKERKGALTNEIIDNYKTERLRPPSKEVISAIVDSDQPVVDMENKLITLNKQCGKLYHYTKMLEAKSELMRSRVSKKRV